MRMKNVYAVAIACILFTALFFVEISISLYFWTEENYEILGYIAWVLIPLFLIICGFIAVKLSAVRKWWFSLVFAVTAYILVLILPVVVGTGLNFSNWGMAAFQAPIIMLFFSAVGGGIYHYVAGKH